MMAGPVITNFEEFFAEAEPVLRAALVSRYGAELGRESAAEALAWGYEHWSEVAVLANPQGYLFRVGQTAARRLRRQGRRDPAVEHRDAAVSWPASEAIDPELERAIRGLPTRQRTVVVLRFGLDLGLEEVAQLLGISMSTVHRHAERGTRQSAPSLG